MITIRPFTNPLIGSLQIPGDKSISHRAVMFASLADGNTRIKNFLPGQDCMSTVQCFRKMGISVTEINQNEIIVKGKGLYGLKEPEEVLDVGNSGTTIRLLSGLLSGQSFFSVLTGDESIRRRPMKRVTGPLRQMGALILGRDDCNKAPLAIAGVHQGKRLQAIEYNSPVASAQVKSAVLLAGLYADGISKVIEPSKSRDHTERMLAAFGGNLTWGDNWSAVEPGGLLKSIDITVPGDISSAAFPMVAALLVPKSEVAMLNVGLNPTRDGILEVLQNMGAHIKIENVRVSGGEPLGDVYATHSALSSFNIGGSIIPKLIDEIPILVVAALFAKGTTTISDAQELRVKETDRIATLTQELRKMGAVIEEKPDGMIVHGGKQLKGAKVKSHGDHRIAMSLAIAGLMAEGDTVIEGIDAIDVSYPGFFQHLKSLGASLD